MKLSFKRNLLVILTLLALTFSSLGVAPASAAPLPPAYYPSGPQANVDESALTGWELCWSSSYGSSGESLAAILTACDGDYLLLAGRPVGSTVFDVLATGLRADVIFDTGASNTPHNANGVGWYYNGSYSWGFAKEGDPISRSTCDIVDSATYPGGLNGDLRLCWHTSSNAISSGWRSGRADFLYGTHERFIYQPAPLKLYGTTGAGGGTSTLVELDPTTGALVQTIGPVGYLVNGLDYDPVSGKMYATTSVNDPTFPGGLLTIDAATGAGTQVAALNPAPSNGVTNVRADASGQLYAWSENSDDLVTINSASGAWSVVGDSGLSTATYGMSFDSSNTLYFVTWSVNTINTTTGAATNTGIAISGIAHHGDFNPQTGKYWGIDEPGSGPKNLKVINVATGAIEQTLPTVANLHTIAFSDGAATPPSDTTAPVLSLPGNMTVEATGPAGTAVTFSATATDETSPAEPVVTCNPTSGSTFALGTTTVNCSASDDAGNTANGSFTITVEDTTAPTVNVPANITAEATGPAGAAASFSTSADDLVDGSLTPVCDANSGDTFPLGTTTVTCSATDNAGNKGSASFDITVQDTTAPDLSVPGDMTVVATSPAGAVVTFSATASDLVDPAPLVTCNPPSGSTFPIGTTTVSCSASDSPAGNISAPQTFDLTVTTPGVSLDPLSHDFGSQAVGTTSAAQSFTLTNSGSSDLTLGTLSISGDFALLNDLCSGQTLTPLGTCAFGVTFSPTAATPLTGEVSIPSDAFSSPNLVPLSGTGFFLAPVTLTNPASSVSLTGATLNGTVNANFDPAVVSFEYGLTDTYGSTVTAAQSPVSGGADTPVSAAISGLLPNTTYHFRAVATNSAGTTYGADLTFKTGMSAPTVSTDAASAIGNRVATLNGTVNAMNDETTVAFEYGLDAGYGNTVSADPSPVTGSSDTPVSAALSGLLQNTTYHFRVVASNSLGTTYGEDMTFTTSFGKLSKSFKSIGSQDGWTLESGEASQKGGTSYDGKTLLGKDWIIGLPTPNPAADLLAGDDDFNRQFRSIVAFNTASLPDNAVIVSVTLKLKKQALVGTNPFNTHKSLLVDIQKPFFGPNASLAPADFQAAAGQNAAGLFAKTPALGWYKSLLKASAFPFINLGGSTQFRIRFQLDDNNDLDADYLRFFGGDADPAYQPVLVIEYYLP